MAHRKIIGKKEKGENVNQIIKLVDKCTESAYDRKRIDQNNSIL